MVSCSTKWASRLRHSSRTAGRSRPLEGSSTSTADVNEYQSYLAWSHNNIGALLADTGRPAEALQSHRQALEIFERLAHDNPTIDAFHHDLAVSRYNIGKLLAETNHPAEALESYRRTLVIRERLARDYPSATLCLSELAACLTNIGDLLKDTKPVAPALESYRRAVEIWERLAHDNPSVHSFQSYLGFTLERIAEIEIGQGRLPEAREKLERAIKHQRAALAAMPRQPFYQQALKFHLLNLAKVHQAQIGSTTASRPTRSFDEAGKIAGVIPVSAQGLERRSPPSSEPRARSWWSCRRSGGGRWLAGVASACAVEPGDSRRATERTRGEHLRPSLVRGTSRCRQRRHRDVSWTALG